MGRRDSNDDPDRRVSRRRYAQLVAGTAVTGLAGCLEAIEGETGLADAEEYEPPDSITLAVDNTPAETNFNEWAEPRRTAGIEYFTEIAAPTNASTAELETSGTGYEADWIDGRDRVTVPSMLAGYEVQPPTEIVETYDDRLTYWDGTPLDAEAMYLHDKLYWYADQDGANAVDDGAAFGGEVVDDYTYRRTTDPGSAPVLESQVFDLERVPIHPEFTRPFHERLEDATTESAAAEIVTELRETALSVEDLVENGWGSGLYEVESVDDVTEERVTARLRDDHPNEHAAIDRLELLWASADQQLLAAERGRIDLGGGVVGTTGDRNRSTLPDHVQQIDRFTSDGGDKLLFNWNDHHLQNLWVRRAIVALVDWRAVGAQGWGADSSIPTEHDTGLHNSVSERYFESSFLDELHQYPREYDLATATEWLRRAGYTGSREDGWTSPDGEPLELTITVHEGIGEHVRACRTIQANLQSLGVPAELDVVPEQPDFASAVGGADPSFQLAMIWADAGAPWNYYWAMGGWWAAPLLGGSQDDWFWLPAEGYGETDTYGVPLEPELPAQTGSIAAPDRAGRRPDVPGGEQIELPPVVHAFRSPETQENIFPDYYRLCARFYNFYLPQFRFHDIAWGVWGNRRDFEFPAAGNPVNRLTKGEFSGHDYQVMAGLPQPSQDPNYPPPPE